MSSNGNTFVVSGLTFSCETFSKESEMNNFFKNTLKIAGQPVPRFLALTNRQTFDRRTQTIKDINLTSSNGLISDRDVDGLNEIVLGEQYAEMVNRTNLEVGQLFEIPSYIEEIVVYFSSKRYPSYFDGGAFYKNGSTA